MSGRPSGCRNKMSEPRWRSGWNPSFLRERMMSLALRAGRSVETEELGIFGGLQDRVCQVYETLVYMDFAREYMEAHGHRLHRQPRDRQRKAPQPAFCLPRPRPGWPAEAPAN